MDPWLIWILLGLVGLGAELLLPGVYLVWVGAAAVGTGFLVLLLGLPFAGAVACFMALVAAGVTLSLWLKPRMLGAAWRVNAPEAGLAGRRATVIGTEAGLLRVRLGDSDWPARLPRGVAGAPPGTLVRVEAVDGTVLVVRPCGPPEGGA
jgi:membrane protein implicated in regulation of membrane protease activity